MISAASIATSVPVPIAMPTSACASAGASLMPSPTIATHLALGLQPACISAGFIGRQHLGQHLRSTPTCRAIASAVRRLSPVSIGTCMPSRCSAAIAASRAGFDRIGDRRSRPAPAHRRRRPPLSLPSALQRARYRARGARSCDVLLVHQRQVCPSARARPSTSALIPWPRQRLEALGLRQRPVHARAPPARSPRPAGARCRARLTQLNEENCSKTEDPASVTSFSPFASNGLAFFNFDCDYDLGHRPAALR